MKKSLLTSRRKLLKLAGFGAAALVGLPHIARAGTASLDAIKQRGYLLYGFNGERPYNYMDAEGNLVGSEIDIARAVASEMGVEAVQGVAMNFDSFIPAIWRDVSTHACRFSLNPHAAKKFSTQRRT